MKLIETLERIERVDQLIRLKATGRPTELACRLGISESSLYNLIDKMRCMGAEIYFCPMKSSYCYKTDVRFIYGFIPQCRGKIYGGKSTQFNRLSIFWSENHLLNPRSTSGG
ncbi:MAG: hypothetical protein AAFY71_27345 [Bacteroidota bacterium]